MGNTNPQNSKLKIFIETEKHFYNSGSSIEGVVFVEALENFKFDALYIRIEGEEWCQWFEGSSKNRVKHTGNAQFYTMQYLLQKYQDQHLSSGKYAYPFSIELSQNIPGSFESAKYDGKIAYKLIAYMVNYTKQDRRQTCQLPILIREPFRQQIVSYKGQSMTNPVSCGCFTKGSVKLTSTFDRNVCLEGQTIGMHLDVDNSQGSDYVDELWVKLVQYTYISANNGVARTYKNIINKHNVCGKRIQKGETKEFDYKLAIPTISHQTAISTLVANYYRIEVTLSTGMLTSENPSIYAPIFILKKSFNLKGSGKKPNLNKNMSSYNQKKPVLFRAPEYWYRRNRNLSVMNYRTEDIVDVVTGAIFNNH